jgi:hypothetical protein
MIQSKKSTEASQADPHRQLQLCVEGPRKRLDDFFFGLYDDEWDIIEEGSDYVLFWGHARYLYHYKEVAARVSVVLERLSEDAADICSRRGAETLVDGPKESS